MPDLENLSGNGEEKIITQGERRFVIIEDGLYVIGKNEERVLVGTIYYTDRDRGDAIIFEYPPAEPGRTPLVMASLIDGGLTPVKR